MEPIVTACGATILLAAPKDGHGAEARWTVATTPVTKTPISATMKIAVEALGYTLSIHSEWRGPGDQSILMHNPSGPGHLVRLCLTPKHEGDLHWHIFEQMRDIRETPLPANHTPTESDSMEDLFEKVFMPSLQIYNVVVVRRIF